MVPADELGVWMRTSNPAFEGQTPIQVIERGEADRVGDVDQIEAIGWTEVPQGQATTYAIASNPNR